MSTESTTLYFKQGGSDKVYNARIEEGPGGYLVNFAFGRRGSTLQTGTKTHVPVPFDEAKKIYDKLVREKTGKGYTPGANGTPYSGTADALRSTGRLPQLLNPIDEALAETLIDDPSVWMQQKMDGKRVIIQVGEKIVGSNRKGLSISLPEPIVQSVGEIGLPCILDGEAIGDRYYAFDLIGLNGVDCRVRPYRERYESLVNLLDAGHGSVEVVEAHVSRSGKRDAFDRLKQANAEGVVFKKSDAPYTPGRPASGGPQLKFKFVATGSFIVAGVNAGKRSIGLEALNGAGRAIYVGNVTVPPNHKMPAVGSVVEVRFLYAFREGCLYQPVMIAVREDIDATACTTAQLKYKPEENDDGE